MLVRSASMRVKPDTVPRDSNSPNITSRKQTKSQAQAVQKSEYIHQLELRNREAEEANNLKTEFLTNMSHELRSPLHTIIGFAELLAEQTVGSLNETQKRFISHIQKDSSHLLNLINDLLDLSKIEAGRLELRYEPIQVGEIVREVFSSVRPRATAKSVEIRMDLSSSVPVLADRLRLKQILHNLLTNAIKFTPSDGKVWVEIVAGNGFAEISVSDTGIGVPEDQQQAVFDKFHQVKAVTSGGTEGTGLGLAITKGLIEQHGGTIWLRSKQGTGSCFTFRIPMAEQAYEESASGGR